MSRIACLVVMVSWLLAVPGPVRADDHEDTGRLSVRSGLGFTTGPETFLLGFEVDYSVIDPQFSLGTHVQIGVDDDYTIVTPVAFARYRFDLSDLGEDWKPVEPYMQGGLGLTYFEKDKSGSDDDDTEFLFNVGLGLEYRFTEEMSVGSQMLFNVIPAEVLDEHFYYSVEVLGFRYRF